MSWDEHKFIGRNTANNNISTSNVTANRDGTVLERTEFIISMITGGAADLRVSQSVSATVEENALQQFTVGLMDIDSGAIASANIDISTIVQTVERSRAGGAFSTVGITQPTFLKIDGQVYCSYQFLAADWQVGDMYRVTLSGVKATIGTQTAYVPAMIWSNLVVESEDLTAEVAKIPKSDAAVTWNATALASINAEVDTALDTIVPASPTAGSLNDALSKAAGGNTFSKATDSLEMLSDKLGAFTGDGGVAQDDSTKASLDLAHTDLDTIITDTEKIYDAALGVAPVDGSLASFVATGGTSLGTRLPADTSLYDTVKNLNTIGVTSAPVANTLSDTLHKDGSFTYDNTTDSLEAISDSISSGTYAVEADSGTASTVVDATYAAYGNDYFNGSLLICTSGANVGQARIVIDFATGTGTFTVSKPFSSAVVATDTFSLISGFKVPEWSPQPATAINATAVVSPGVDLLDLVDTDNKETYKLNNLRIKCADPGANTVTITLYELINDVSTAVDTFTITTDNYGTYYSLFDMFGVSHVSGDDITVNATSSAGSYAITGNYQYDISYNA